MEYESKYIQIQNRIKIDLKRELLCVYVCIDVCIYII